MGKRTNQKHITNLQLFRRKTMAIEKIKSDGSITVNQVKVLIYGQPGLGKTTLSLTTKNPLVLDFDGGAHRAGNRNSGEIWRFETWSDVVAMMRTPDELRQFDTIVIDTVGRCLDYLTAQLISDNPKSGTRNGGLSISGWGELKQGFSNWIKQLTLLGKDVIMIAHDKEKDENDVRILRPDVSGGSYAEIMKLSDFVGYMYKGNKDVTMLNFSPTERTIGKNSAKFPILQVPDVVSEPHYFAGKIEDMKTKLSGFSENDLYNRKIVSAGQSRIAELNTLDEVNSARTKIGLTEEPIKSQLKSALLKRVHTLGFEYDKKLDKFIDTNIEKKQEPETDTYVHKQTLNLDALLNDSSKSKNGAFAENEFM